MQRLYSLLSIFILASILAGCARSPSAQPKEISSNNSSTVLTDLPEKSKLSGSAKSEVLPHDPPASCPVTQAPDAPFLAPEPYPSEPPERYANQFWYGTPELWTMLGTDGIWDDLPHNQHGYSQKVFWWSQDFHVSADPYPAFNLTIERLDTDAPATPIVVSEKATNASADFGTAMLTGVDIPEPGCWKITGQYKQTKLNFVIWVAP